MDNYSILAQIGESRTWIVIYHGVIFMLAVIVITALVTGIICWTIETLEESARKFRTWLKGPKRIGRTMWA